MQKLLTILVLGLATLAGCHQAGHTLYERAETRPDGTRLVQRVEVLTPPHAAKPGTIQFAADGTLSASTGTEAYTTPASKSLAKLTWLGGLLLAGGILALLLKAKIPLVPAELGLGLLVSGLLLMVLPSLIEAYLGYILLGLVATAVAVTIWRVNRLQAD